MSWVKIDDGAYQHEKLLDVGAKAAWLWVCGLSYCNGQERRDGFIPLNALKVMYPGVGLKEAERLVEFRLWERAERGFLIHDYHDYQPTEEQAAQLKADRAAAGRLGGIRSAEARAKQRLEASAAQANKQNASSGLKQTNEANEPPSRPDPVPTPPDPKTEPPPVASEANTEPEDPGRETMCPVDLAKRLEKNGTLKCLAEQLSEPIESIRHEADQFVLTWTFGKLAGQLRTGWAGKCRQWIIDQKGKGQLKPLGAIEHDRQRGRDASGPGQVAPSKYLAEVQQLVAERGRG